MSKTLGEMSQAERSAAIGRAAGQLQQEMQRNAAAVTAVLDELPFAAADVSSPRELAERYGEVRPHWMPAVTRAQRNPERVWYGWASYLESARARELAAGIAEPVPQYVVTFDPREIAGPGAIEGLRRMPLADAERLARDASPRHGRIVNADSLAELEPAVVSHRPDGRSVVIGWHEPQPATWDAAAWQEAGQ